MNVSPFVPDFLHHSVGVRCGVRPLRAPSGYTSFLPPLLGPDLLFLGSHASFQRLAKLRLRTDPLGSPVTQAVLGGAGHQVAAAPACCRGPACSEVPVEGGFPLETKSGLRSEDGGLRREGFPRSGVYRRARVTDKKLCTPVSWGPGPLVAWRQMNGGQGRCSNLGTRSWRLQLF